MFLASGPMLVPEFALSCGHISFYILCQGCTLGFQTPISPGVHLVLNFFLENYVKELLGPREAVSCGGLRSHVRVVVFVIVVEEAAKTEQRHFSNHNITSVTICAELTSTRPLR